MIQNNRFNTQFSTSSIKFGLKATPQELEEIKTAITEILSEHPDAANNLISKMHPNLTLVYRGDRKLLAFCWERLMDAFRVTRKFTFSKGQKLIEVILLDTPVDVPETLTISHPTKPEFFLTFLSNQLSEYENAVLQKYSIKRIN